MSLSDLQCATRASWTGDEMSTGRLENQVAVVTGAGSRASGIGNGRAVAVAMARERASVALLDLDEGAARATHEMIASEGGRSVVIHCDVRSAEACGRALDEVLDTLGVPGVLVNNVGIPGPPGTALDVDLDEWTKTLHTNVTAMVLMARACLPHMIEAGRGCVINMASITGMVGGFPHLCYPTTKGAIISMTRSMAAHHARDGIRVNCIAPGLVYTPYVGGDDMSAEVRAQRRLLTPLGTEGTAWDVAGAAVFLASCESRWITGVVLPVDAGDSAIRGGVPYVLQ